MKLLLAEDERDLSNAIKRVLEYSKYEVVCAYDGVQALNKIHEEKFDGLILDVTMPRMDGFEVVSRLRKEGNAIPVLMLTARAEIDDKVTGLDAGADDYMTKPFEIKELLARIRAMLRRKENEVHDVFSIGNVTLDPSTAELKAITSVRLNNKEYHMMETLIRNKNILLSSERLMELVWDYDSPSEINVVWANLSSLRKKLDEIGADITIKAVRGIGYKLEQKSNDKKA